MKILPFDQKPAAVQKLTAPEAVGSDGFIHSASPKSAHLFKGVIFDIKLS
jgi:hypothetical protein